VSSRPCELVAEAPAAFADRTTARIVGVLFVIATATAIVGGDLAEEPLTRWNDVPRAEACSRVVAVTADTHESERTLAVVRQFLEAVGRHDVDAILASMTDDAVYENFGDDVDRGRHEGHSAIGTAFEAVFAAYPDCRSDTDELFASGDRCCYCWTMRWTEADGSDASSCGTDVFVVRDGRVASKKTFE
jgi:ketosteroid isomerase-like protein